MFALPLVLCHLTSLVETAGSDDRISGAQRVVAAIVAAARENQRNAEPRQGDHLTAYYIQAAAREAKQLPAKVAGPSFLLGIGVGLDTAQLLRTVPFLQSTWSKIESTTQRTARLKILGKPTMRKRHDLTQHFAVSAALTVMLGETLTESVGVSKELLDAQEGGSGFSFLDLTADLAGIRFAREMMKKPERLTEVEKKFRVEDYLPDLKGIEEGFTRKQFEAKYGGIRDDRFRKMRDQIQARIANLPVYKARSGSSR